MRSFFFLRLVGFRTVGFVIGFSTFLLGCVDYSHIRHGRATRLSEVVVSRCVSRWVTVIHLIECIPSTSISPRFSGFTFLFFLLFTTFFLWQIISYVLSIMRLMDMYRFYTHLLHIPDVRSFLYLSPFPYILTWTHVGWYPNNILARSRPPHRRNPRRQPSHCHLLPKPHLPLHHCQTRRTWHRQSHHASRKLPHRAF